MRKYKTQIESRSLGRFEVKVPPVEPWVDAELIESPVVLPLVQVIMVVVVVVVEVVEVVAVVVLVQPQE